MILFLNVSMSEMVIGRAIWTHTIERQEIALRSKPPKLRVCNETSYGTKDLASRKELKYHCNALN